MPRQRPPEDSLPALIGRLVRDARLEVGFTLADLAAYTGLSTAVIRRYEFGDRSPSWEAWIRIARACDVTPSVLMSYLDDFPLSEIEVPEETVRKKRKKAAA